MVKKILIIGGTGLLGINWALQEKGKYQFHLGINNREVVLDGVYLQKIDLNNIEDIYFHLEKIKPIYVVNAAALTNIEQCELNKDLAKKVNVDLAVNIAIVCKRLNIPFVHISTDHIFSGNNSYYEENDIPEPLNYYGLTKLNAEKSVKKINPDSLIIRTNFYGWGTSYRKSFSDFIYDNLVQGKKIHLFNDVFYTPILINSLIQSINKLINLNKNGIYNIIGAERISKYEFGKTLADRFNLDSSLINEVEYNKIMMNQAVRRPFDMSLSSKKLLKVSGIIVPKLSSDLDALFQGLKNGYKNAINKI